MCGMNDLRLSIEQSKPFFNFKFLAYLKLQLRKCHFFGISNENSFLMNVQ